MFAFALGPRNHWPHGCCAIDLLSATKVWSQSSPISTSKIAKWNQSSTTIYTLGKLFLIVFFLYRFIPIPAQFPPIHRISKARALHRNMHWNPHGPQGSRPWYDWVSQSLDRPPAATDTIHVGFSGDGVDGVIKTRFQIQKMLVSRWYTPF